MQGKGTEGARVFLRLYPLEVQPGMMSGNSLSSPSMRNRFVSKMNHMLNVFYAYVQVWADGRGQGVTSETWSQLHGMKHRESALDRPGQILQEALQILSIYSIFQMSLLIECLMAFVHRGGW